jgi:Spy/CpxP family protein refolding chaperone
MFTQKIKKSLLISSFLIVGLASLAFARGGGSWDCPYGNDGPRMGHGMGKGMMGGGHGNWADGRGANLTDEQKAKLDAAREKFFTETEPLRIQMRDKHFALQDEMNKKEPDSAKVAQLQKELSQIEAEFDQKRVQHQLEMRQLLPEGVRCPGYGPGSGRGHKGHERW